MEKRRKLKNDEMKTSILLELLLLFVALIFLTSCSSQQSMLPTPQEMGNMALLRSIAVDTGENDLWKVTVSTGKQSKGLQGEQEAPLVLGGESISMEGACRQLEGQSDHSIFYGYIDQMFISTDLASKDVEKVLEYVASSNQLSLGTGIWLVEGQAEELLLATKEEGAEAYFSTIVEESKLGTAGITRKVGEILTELRENNSSYIPVFTTNEQGILVDKGYGIIKNNKFVALLQGEEAKGLTFLEGHDQLLELSLDSGNYAVDLSQISLQYKGQWENDQKLNSVEILLSMEGDLLEYPQLPSQEEQEKIKRAIEEQVEELGNNTIKKLKSLDTDILNLQGELALRKPHYSQLLELEWQQCYPTLSVKVECEVNLSEVNGF